MFESNLVQNDFLYQMEGVSLVYSNLAMSLYLFCSRGIFKSIGYSFGYHHIVFATWV
jgi:hypothetical protein